jgi:hypothetical protein
LTATPCDIAVTCGISIPLGMLSPTRRQVSYALLTRSPLYSRYCYLFRVRLACLIHAANVRSEPGSNSPLCYSSHHARCPRHPRYRGINKRSLESEDPRRILQGSTTHACTIRLSKSWTRDLREFGFFGPNRELTNSTATCQCEKLLFQEVRTRRRAILSRVSGDVLDRAVVRQD